MKPRHSDSGQGWIKREFREIRKLIRESNAGRRLESATIGKGGLRVKRGGQVVAEYPSGPDAAYWGRLFRDLNGDLVYGIALLDHDGSSIFTAYSYDIPGDRGIVNADAEWVDFIGYTQASMQWPDPSGGLPNMVRVTSAGVLLQAITGTHKMPGMTTTGSSPNLWIDVANGDVKRSVSSRRYKQDIATAVVDLAKVLALVPRRFRMKADVEELGDDAPVHTGFIAEEAHELGLSEWVTYNAEGEPEAFDYATFCVAQQAVLVDLNARLTALEDQLNGGGA